MSDDELYLVCEFTVSLLDVITFVLTLSCNPRFSFKVAEHSFQEPMPNSQLLFSHLCFGARFLQE